MRASTKSAGGISFLPQRYPNMTNFFGAVSKGNIGDDYEEEESMGTLKEEL